MSLTVASWNVNSLRARLDHVNRFLREVAPDVVCLQEIKVENDKFPTQVFLDNGYDHIVSTRPEGLPRRGYRRPRAPDRCGHQGLVPLG